MKTKFGSYVGNATNGHAITGIGFQPDLVIVKGTTVGNNAYFKTTSMSGTNSMVLRADTGFQTARIVSLDSDGFTVDNDGFSDVNGNLVTYVYAAFKDDGAGDFAYGTYVGNSTDNRNLTLQSTFPFTWLVIKGDGARTGAYRDKALSGDKTHQFYSSGTTLDQIQSMGTSIGDVQLGTADHVNQNLRTYYWFGFKEVSGFCTSFTYTGNGGDNRNIVIPSTSFQPGFVWIKREDASDPRFRTTGHSGDASQSFDASQAANDIQAFNTDGFQVGTSTAVNNNLSTYHALAIKEGTSAVSIPNKVVQIKQAVNRASTY